MQQWRIHEIGDPWETMVLDDVDEPVPAPNSVLIDVEAVGLTFPDLLMAQGKYQVPITPPHSPGSEVAGTITAVGSGVDGFAVGERVYASRGAGLSTKATISTDQLFKVPSTLTSAQATALAVNFGTTYFALFERANIQEGETLLVTAAAGGVGSAAVQLGKAAGAKVIAVAGGPEKIAFCLENGADAAVDYLATPNFVDEVRELSGGGVDVCYEVVGGDTFHHARRCMAWDGRLLIIGFTSGTIADAPTNHALLKNYSIVGVHWGASLTRDPSSMGRQQAALADLAEAGKVNPPLMQPYSFADAPQAFDDLAHRRTRGKVVVDTTT